MKRLLSVIIPSYNHARFIAEAIESVAAQRHENLELVVVDDGSTDESVEVIRSVLAEVDIPHVQLIEQENRGAPAAIDRGVQASAGEWLSILNSDDTFHPERFSRIREEVPEEGDFFAFSMVRMVDHERRPLPDSSETVAGYQHALYEASQCPTIGYALLRNNFSVTSGNFVFTRALYDKLGGFGNYELAHDWDFLLRALYHVEPIFVTKRLLDYRTHAHNTRHGLQDQSLVEGRRILNDYLALCANSPTPWRPAKKIGPSTSTSSRRATNRGSTAPRFVLISTDRQPGNPRRMIPPGGSGPRPSTFTMWRVAPIFQARMPRPPIWKRWR